MDDEYGFFVIGLLLLPFALIFGIWKVMFWILAICGIIMGIVFGLSLIGWLLEVLKFHLVKAVTEYPKNKAERKEKQQQMKEEARREQERIQIEKEMQRLGEENEPYRAYSAAVAGSRERSKLAAATKIIDHLNDDDENRSRVIPFFHKYLPLMTEALRANRNNDEDLDDMIKSFTETVKAFSRSLYKEKDARDVIDINKAVLEQLAVRDGLYDPEEELMVATVGGEE